MEVSEPIAHRYTLLQDIANGIPTAFNAKRADSDSTPNSAKTDASPPAADLHAQLQSEFQSLLATLSPTDRQIFQRYNTEIFKEIQMLGPDLARLSLLKPGSKQEQLLGRVSQRCTRIQDYITTLIAPDKGQP